MRRGRPKINEAYVASGKADKYLLDRYVKYKERVAESGGSPVIENFATFKSNVRSDLTEGKYSSVNDLMKKYVFESVYNNKYEAYLTQRKIYLGLQGGEGLQETERLKGMSLKERMSEIKEIKNMTTREFAEKNSEDIMKYYNKLKEEGKSGKEASKLVASRFFGSEDKKEH